MTENIREVNTGIDRKKTVTYHMYDYGLLFLVLFFVGLGLILIYSTSSYYASNKFGDSFFFMKKQGIYALAGIGFMLVISKIDYRIYIKPFTKFKIRPIYLLAVLCYALQIYVLIFGEDIYGAKRWIEIPKVGSFQPSEISKVCVIMFTAFICYQAPTMMNYFAGFLRAAFYEAVLIILIAVEDLSTAIICAGVFFIICFVTSKKFGYFIAALGVFAGGVATYIFLGSNFRTERIAAWLNIDSNAAGLQIRRGLYAIASGGLFGKGLGESSMKLGYVPESHNDMIFSIICEELGFFGAIAILLLFVLLLWRIYTVAINVKDLFGSLICVGVMAHIGLQVVMNVAVVTNSIPATGIALPFISYGGTSLLLLLCEIGLVLSVSYRVEVTEQK